MIDTKYAPYAALVLRVLTGVLFIIHGLTKVFVFTPAGTAGYFQSLGLPGFLGYVAIALELVGGVALILGVYSRIFAVIFGVHLLGAALFGHAQNGFSFAAPNGGGWEYPVMWAVVMFALALLGDGAKALRPTTRI
ncbi:DoxX family protein [Paenirhodobacter populi]|uniref:DoxX family protein n=1 Tax=Paenirhodobacter populi TaxID=2306993 RepID=A0A443JI32_9RHOB|nr:DoxX family protein [Sinirhodobacter populi]RWR20124.1 DoxX family protein [Sinirhodobacter populi]